MNEQEICLEFSLQCVEKIFFCGYVVLKLHFRIFARFNRMFAIRISVGLGTGGLKLKTFLVTINLSCRD